MKSSVISFLWQRNLVELQNGLITPLNVHLAIDGASVSNRMDIVRYLIDCFKSASPPIVLTVNTFNMVANHGDLDLLKQLYSSKTAMLTRAHGLDHAVDYAASNNNMDMVKWMSENGKGGSSGRALEKAAAKGYLEMVRYLNENRRFTIYSIRAMVEAAANNHIDVVKYLHQHGKESCSVEVMNIAAANGHLEVVKFLEENRNEGCDQRAMNDAATNGHFDVVVYLFTHRQRECNLMSALLSASINGHMDIIRFLFPKVSSVGEADMLDLVKLGCLNSIRLVHEMCGDQLFKGILVNLAIKQKHLDILDFIYNNCKNINYSKSIFELAVHTYDLDIIQFVLNMDVSYLYVDTFKSLISEDKYRDSLGIRIYDVIEMMVERFV
ncbi:hypothetical protein PPL_04357 [Heterostelium album PN500]|uniref:Ankyrin repeat protein n=1 Tax=Heterostelium pallidum (strain ATCC 26659 / Pp 5 / PN500) TaxID=670386 RepID=D3B7C0_HETP5|nr:hypothetical protein PPL_04357 [Heterostelium album PN500]EFA82663.1 hypothetical protein PPL_04357 [Heterostelium album PN500]|eukprot:XP_020434780.1 hypothetical protein PPL_04357 [Heterostelium album PN500]